MVGLLVLQSSSLWSRLLLLPIRGLLVLRVSGASLSGLPGLLVIIVFVGGLLVLLVSVASISFQDQGVSLHYFIIIVTATCSTFLVESAVRHSEEGVFLIP